MSPSLETVRAELTSAMAGAAPGRPMADTLCEACVDLFDVDGAALSVVVDGSPQGTFGSSSSTSRRLEEYQFTFGEGPCLDAVDSRQAVLAPDLDSPDERRWPAFSGALLADGFRSVFALPVMLTSVCVGALDLFRADPGPLDSDQLAGAALAARLASAPLLDLIADAQDSGGSGRSLDDRLLVDGEDGWGHLADMDRIEVYQATGMLIAQLDVGATEALLRLRAHAMVTGQTASEVAWAILERRLVLEDDAHDRPGGTTR